MLPINTLKVGGYQAKCWFLLTILMALYLPQNLMAQSWEYQNPGVSTVILTVDAYDENHVFAGGFEGLVLVTDDGGATWLADNIPNTEGLDVNSIVAVGESTAYATVNAYMSPDARIYKTTDNGVTWEMQYQNTGTFAYFNSISFWDAEHGIAASDPIDNGEFLILTTSDGGATWTEVPSAALPDPNTNEWTGWGDGGGTCTTTYGTDHVWVGTAYPFGTTEGPVRVLKSADQGQSWTAYETPLPAGTGIFSITFLDELNGFASGYGMIQTVDGGETWTTVESMSDPDVGIGTVVYVPDTNGEVLVATTTMGSVYSIDGGTSWTIINDDFLAGLSFVGPSVGWVCGFDGANGVIASFDGLLYSSLDELYSSDLIKVEAHPNPFEGATNIQFNLESPSSINLVIMDATGKQLQTLSQGQYPAGEHSAILHAADLSSGVYFYRLITEQGEVTGKIVLRK